ITIDGKDSKDFDDAISIEKAKQGYTLYVHIADVSFYVNVNSALDKEAFRRGNSWYLANSVIPMLPAVLSEKICSLNPKTKRLAFTCEMQFNKAGEIVSYSFYKSKIYLKRRYTYEQAEKELKKKKGKLSLFYELTKILEEKRNKEGRIALEIPEMQADWDETGRLISIRQKERLESHKLIEECMLSANICAARYAKKHRLPFLYRVHEKPPAEEVEKINLFLQLFGISKRIKKISAKSIASILNSISDEDTKAIFHYLLLRTFTQAVYAPDTIGHWGLGFSDYAHFTSPIRRYADLVIHRQLAAHLEKKPLPYNEGDLKFIGMETSRCEREAMSAERDIRKLLIGRSFETRIGENFEAWITGFHSEGIFIALSESIAEGFIPVQYVSKKAELLMLDELRAVADKLGKTLIMGQKLQVKLLEVDFAKIRMNFEPIL
ncbi:MAG: VacB/RNase II family 3'-5' exoribonuclease, partial [Candidatus Hydrogenedentota bacterium]